MRNAILYLLVLLCAGCSNYSANLPSIKPYKMDIQQGNVVTSKMMLQLRPGMTHAQVRFVLGTPLLTDSFHANRWDYLYRMQKDGKVIEQRHVILEFEGDQLKRVRGDVIPAGSDTEQAATTATGESKPVVDLKKTEPKKQEKGLVDKLKFWKSDEETPAPKTEQAPQPEPVQKVEPAPAEAPAEPARMVPQETAKPAAEEPVPQEAAKPVAAEPAPQAVSKPVPPAEPAARPAPKAEPAPVAEKTPAPKKVAPVAEELKTAPKPADDLPPEDDPGYFERMLEQIGF